MTIIIYHNPRCSKSRATLQLLQQKQADIQIEAYLEKRYTVAELQQLMKKLGICMAREMMRTQDDLYRQLKLDDPQLNEQQLLEAITEHPALLERPIVINGEKAKIGRPPESVLEIL